MRKYYFLTRFILGEKIISTLLVTCLMVVKPLNIMLLKSSAYVKSYDGQTKWMYFLIEDNYLLKTIIVYIMG